MTIIKSALNSLTGKQNPTKKLLLVCPYCNCSHIERVARSSWSFESQSYISEEVTTSELAICHGCDTTDIDILKEVDASGYSEYQVEMIDAWTKAPDWAKYIAREDSGNWYYYDQAIKPNRSGEFVSLIIGDPIKKEILDKSANVVCDPKRSMIKTIVERPVYSQSKR